MVHIRLPKDRAALTFQFAKQPAQSEQRGDFQSSTDDD
jgi:hypothetical protein